MLNAYNEKLAGLREKMARRGKVEAMLAELRRQEGELAARVGELARALQMEQEDVDRLNGGFRSIYYAVIGKKQEMLEKEQAEVLAASMKYETAKNELEAVQKEIDRLGWEQSDIKRYEREYNDILSRKIDVMRVRGVRADEIARIEEQKAGLDIQLRELREAMTAGRRAQSQIDLIAEHLDKADDYAVWDMFSGGILADIAKHVELDDAQQGVQTLERLLRAFKTELADISIQTEIYAEIAGPMRFADFFFDGFIVDSMVRSHISGSKESLKNTERQVRQVMDQLRKMEREMSRRQEKLDGELRNLAEEG